MFYIMVKVGCLAAAVLCKSYSRLLCNAMKKFMRKPANTRVKETGERSHTQIPDGDSFQAHQLPGSSSNQQLTCSRVEHLVKENTCKMILHSRK